MIPLSVFPLVTAAVYILLWGKQNAHGKSIVSTSASLFFLYVLTGTAHILKAVYGREIANKESSGCVFIGKDVNLCVAKEKQINGNVKN